MTSRIEAWAGQQMSESEAVRAEAEAAQYAESRMRAARVVAACASDADEFRVLAEMLGLDRADLAAARRGTKKSHRAA
jgi:hypothetical protein